MKIYLKYGLIILTLVFTLSLQGCRERSDLPDMRETFSFKEHKPFGTAIAYKLLEKAYPAQSITIQHKGFNESAALTNDSTSIYLDISRNYFVSSEDANSILDFVYKGNTAIISASQIDTVLLDKLYFKQQSFNDKNPLFSDTYANTHLSLVPAVRSIPETTHEYYYYPFVNYFSEVNGKYSRIVGYNELNRPNFVVFFWGRGRLFLHAEPRAFSNYFLLHEKNCQYLLQFLQILPDKPQRIFWDDYYNKINYKEANGSRSFLGAVLANPPLRWAFWILMAVLTLFVFVNGKRRQRIIPVIKPVQNSSVAFAEAIAGLYLKEKSNKTIADKMVTYFNELIRSKYFMNSNIFDEDFLTTLSKKSNVPLAETQRLFRTIKQLAAQTVVGDPELLDLNEQIQQFIKPIN